MTIEKHYKRLDRYETDKEGLQEVAEEKGLKKPNDEIYIAEAKYQFEHAKTSNYYSPIFSDYDLRNRDAEYKEEYKATLKDFRQLERFYNKFCK